MIALYELERPALQEFSEALKRTLLADNREELVGLLELQGGLAEDLTQAERLVDLFLLPEDHPRAAPLWASLRRVSKKRAMTKMFTSTHTSLEGRMRAFDVLRENKAVARSVDRLLNPKRLPWYLRRADATGGWLDEAERAQLVIGLKALRPALTEELVELLDGLDAIDGDVVAHDGL